MTWSIKDQQIGPLRIGQSRRAVRNIVSEQPRNLPGTEDSDQFPTHGVRVEYDDMGHAEFIEVASPCDAIFAGRNLLGMKLDAALDLFFSLGHAPTYDGDEPHPRFDDVGIALYVGGTDGKSIEAVSVYGAGYYE